MQRVHVDPLRWRNHKHPQTRIKLIDRVDAKGLTSISRDRSASRGFERVSRSVLISQDKIQAQAQ